MIRQVLLGAAVCVITVMIHALVMTAVVRAAQMAGAMKTSHQWLLLITVMIVTVAVLMAAHSSEVFVWSLAYAAFKVAPDDVNDMYFAFVNYTTLGYGDVVPVERWQLIGPITAMNGILLFGWSTAVIFEVLRRAMTHSGIAAVHD